MLTTWLLLSPATAGPVCDPAAIAEGLVINEILVDPEGTGAGLQWLEIYNETGLDLDASQWQIRAGDATYDTVSVLPDGTWFIDGEFLVIAQVAAPFADLVVPGFEAGPGVSDADSVRVTDCFGAPVDTVIYGPSNPDGWRDDTGAIATSWAPSSASGQALARVADGQDTQRSGDDFALVTVSTPGSSNVEPPVHCGGPGAGIVLNELFDDGSSWVEVLHLGAAPALLGGWSLAIGTTTMAPAYTFAAGQVLSPGGRFVVGDIPEAVYDADLSFAGATAVRLTDCDGFAADTIVFGDNAAGWVGDDGVAAIGVAPALAAGLSLSRLPDGADSDDSAVDLVRMTPTPAVANVEPPDPTGTTDTAPDTAPDTGTPPEPTTDPDPTLPAEDTDSPATEDSDTPATDTDPEKGCGCDTRGEGVRGGAAPVLSGWSLALALLALATRRATGTSWPTRSTGRTCR